jgi:hypothetical protein
MTSRAWRLPMLVLLPLLVVAGLAIERRDDDEATISDDVVAPVGDLAAVAPAEGSLGSTWYCAAGSATGDPAGVAEQMLVIANLTDGALDVDVTVFVPEGEPVVTSVPVPPDGRTPVRVSDVVKAQWASVVVEARGGRVAVEQVLTGPLGRTVSPCATRPSTTWYFPAGTTRAGTQEYIALFNPFPDEASVDITLETEEGARTPTAFQGFVVPGSSVRVVDIGSSAEGEVGATLADRVAATVRARNGRIVAEQLLTSDGTATRVEDEAGTVVDEGLTTKGIAAAVGAPAGAPSWVFPAVPVPAPGVRASIAVMNPTDRDTDVQIQVFLDEPEVNGSVEPFALSIPPGRTEVRNLFEDARIKEGVGGWALVQSSDGVPVVAQMLEEGVAPAPPGLTTSMGSPVVAGSWVLPAGSVADLAGTSLTVVNPAAVGDARVRLIGRAQGREELLAGGDIVIPAGRRISIDMAADGRGITDLVVEVVGDAPVVVSRRFAFASVRDVAVSLALPVAGTQRVPVDLARPVATEPEPPVAEGTGDTGGAGPNVTLDPAVTTTTGAGAPSSTTASTAASTTTASTSTASTAAGG